MKTCAYFFFFLGLALPAWSLYAQEASLGRLFFTPERRASLERQRALNLPPEQTLGKGDMLALNGLVVRNNGQRTLWINGKTLTEKSPLLQVKLHSEQPGKATLLTNNNQTNTLRVGNTVNLNSGAEASALGSGSIRVHGR